MYEVVSISKGRAIKINLVMVWKTEVKEVFSYWSYLPRKVASRFIPQDCTLANARTGKVPIPLILGGMALK